VLTVYRDRTIVRTWEAKRLPTDRRPQAMSDFKLSAASFSDTTIDAVAVSEAAKVWLASKVGTGAVSVTLPKSSLQAFSDAAETANLSVQ